MRHLLADVVIAWFVPWRVVRRVTEQARFGFSGPHTLSGLLVYPAIIGAFLLLTSLERAPAHGITGQDLPAPQAGLMTEVVQGIMSEAPPASQWVPRAAAGVAGWLATGAVAGFVSAAMIAGLLVAVLMAVGQRASTALSSIWRLSSIATLLLPIAVVALISWAFVYAGHLTGNTGGQSVKIALAVAATSWASAALWLIAWTTQRDWTSGSRFRRAAMAVVFSAACWLVLLMESFVVTQPLRWLGIGIFQRGDMTRSTLLDQQHRIR